MKYNRLSRYKIKKIILCFSEDITASSASKLLSLNRKTINAYYNALLFQRRANAYNTREDTRRIKIHTDGWKAYDGLILNGYNHYRVFHHENEFARGKSHVNGIECF